MSFNGKNILVMGDSSDIGLRLNRNTGSYCFSDIIRPKRLDERTGNWNRLGNGEF